MEEVALTEIDEVVPEVAVADSVFAQKSAVFTSWSAPCCNGPSSGAASPSVSPITPPLWRPLAPACRILSLSILPCPRRTSRNRQLHRFPRRLGLRCTRGTDPTDQNR